MFWNWLTSWLYPSKLRYMNAQFRIRTKLAKCKRCGSANLIPRNIPINFLKCRKCGNSEFKVVGDNSKKTGVVFTSMAAGAGIGAIFGPEGSIIGSLIGLIAGSIAISGNSKE